jgi:hypothetical protein
MSDILNKTIVLVLNRHWQAITIRTPKNVFFQMAMNAATALDIEGESHIRPATWDDWITSYCVRAALPIHGKISSVRPRK